MRREACQVYLPSLLLTQLCGHARRQGVAGLVRPVQVAIHAAALSSCLIACLFVGKSWQVVREVVWVRGKRGLEWVGVNVALLPLSKWLASVGTGSLVCLGAPRSFIARVAFFSLPIDMPLGAVADLGGRKSPCSDLGTCPGLIPCHASSHARRCLATHMGRLRQAFSLPSCYLLFSRQVFAPSWIIWPPGLCAILLQACFSLPT